MTETTEYGSAGLLGVLTPQANTTVEPEFWALLPPGWSLINARLTSPKPTIEERLVDYTTRFGTTAEQFANAPVTALAAACTGASYLIGLEAEDRLTAEIEARFAVPFLTGATASLAMLAALGARRVALLTPYPESLNLKSLAYWRARGLDIAAHEGPAPDASAFHPIYAMRGSGVLAAYRQLSETDCDVILMLGTGMATLDALLAGRDEGLRPAISCNLALVWAATQPDTDPAGWIAGGHWAPRYRALFASEG